MIFNFDVDNIDIFSELKKKLKSTPNETKEDEIFQGDLSKIDDFLKYHKFIIYRKEERSKLNLRRSNANKAFIICSFWCVFIASIIVLHGYTIETCKFTSFKLTEREFIFICGTLTVSVFVFYLRVIKNLFPNNDNTTNKRKKKKR